VGDGDGARYPGAHEVVNRGVRVPRPRLEAPAPATAPQDLVPNTTTGRADTHETDRPSCAAQCERKTSSESLTRAGRQTERWWVGSSVVYMEMKAVSAMPDWAVCTPAVQCRIGAGAAARRTTFFFYGRWALPWVSPDAPWRARKLQRVTCLDAHHLTGRAQPETKSIGEIILGQF